MSGRDQHNDRDHTPFDPWPLILAAIGALLVALVVSAWVDTEGTPTTNVSFDLPGPTDYVHPEPMP